MGAPYRSSSVTSLMDTNRSRHSSTRVSTASASLALQQQAAANYRPIDWDSLSPEKKAAWDKAVHEYYSKPFWAEPLPLPPEIDLKAIIDEDKKFIALLIAIRKVADERGVSIAAQLDAWNYGRGEQ